MSNYTSYCENTINQNSFNPNQKFYIRPADKSTLLDVSANIVANNGNFPNHEKIWNSNTYAFDVGVYFQLENIDDVTNNTARIAFYNGNSKIMECDLFRLFVYRDIVSNQVSLLRDADAATYTATLLQDVDGTGGTPLDLRFHPNTVNATTTSAHTLTLPDLTVTVNSHLANIPGVGTITLGEYMDGFEFYRGSSTYSGINFMNITTANTTNTKIYANRASGNPFATLVCRMGQNVRIKVIIVDYNAGVPVYGYHVTENKSIAT